MKILELKQHIEVVTPKGRGRVWLVTEYGQQVEKVFTCILDESGGIWEFTNKDIRATNNLTFGRGAW